MNLVATAVRKNDVRAEKSPVKTIVVIGYPGVETLDLFGPLETFAKALDAKGRRGYSTRIVGLTMAPIVTESGIYIQPHATMEDDFSGDTILVPGGEGLRNKATQQVVASWLARNANSFRRVASVCTGIYGLAASGLLNGRRVTTHWKFADDVAQKFPHLVVEPDAIFIQDGKYFTSGGLLAGVDLALALIQQDYGPRVALDVARNMLVYLKRTGGQSQFSEPLRFQTRAVGAFADLEAWINTHLAEDLNLTTLAARVSLSPRQFSRRFRAAYKISPAAYVRDIRLDMAKIFLVEGTASLDRIASRLGFRSEDSFRRAFERQFGIGPGLYRQSFKDVLGASSTVSVRSRS
jgi:transcriptional regulator GlxA family with amidase domain